MGPIHHSYDILIIGSGLSGICALIHLRKRFPDYRIKVLEAGDDVGGTWYWNRYPGCRVDTESTTYGFSFDKELLEEWNWKELYTHQGDLHKYIKRVAEKHDLYRDVEFGVRVKSAHWDDDKRTWTFIDDAGNTHTTKWFVSCMGFLSTPTRPAIAGIDNFKGQAFHTSRWPDDLNLERDLAGKRIGIIGTGATGVQTITAISQVSSIKSLTVFQRTANWAAPLWNQNITKSEMEEYKRQYDEMFQRCANSSSGFLHEADKRKSSQVSDEERLAHYEKIYHEPGFAKWLGVFSDTFTDRKANDQYSQFIADKIRQRVHDPETADSLIPKDHGFGTRRVPLESGYFEAYNKKHIKLVDLRKTPIEHITEDGIATSEGLHELDILIYATGFDAITGAFSAIEWHAKNDRPLVASSDTPEGHLAIWPDHRPSTYLGMLVPALPNTFMVLGPHQPYGNTTRSIEWSVNVISDLLAYVTQHGYTYVEPTVEATAAWTDHVVECSAASSLINEVDSWLTGVNKNVPGKNVRSVARYTGSAIEYRRRCDEFKNNGYTGLILLKDDPKASQGRAGQSLTGVLHKARL